MISLEKIAVVGSIEHAHLVDSDLVEPLESWLLRDAFVYHLGVDVPHV